MPFVADLWAMAADHVADVVLRHFIVGQVERRVAVLLQAVDHLQRFLAVGDLDADEDVGLGGGVVAVVNSVMLRLPISARNFL